MTSIGRKPADGFTLVEMVIVIVLIGIIASVIAVFIRHPVESYFALSRRAELVDASSSAMNMMTRDIRNALPNSVRVDPAGTTIEMINLVEGVRYRDQAWLNDQRLRINANDSSFNAVGRFMRITTPFSSTTERLVIYHTGQSGADAYAGDNVITPTTTTITITTAGVLSGEDRVTLSANHRFPFASPRQRVFLVNGTTRYTCDMAAGTLRRNSSTNIPNNLVPVPAGAPVVTAHMGACSFNYDAGTATRAGIVTIRLSLTDAGETVSLLQQVHVDNVP
jgi:MSHA biogenesis protein MshO